MTDSTPMAQVSEPVRQPWPFVLWSLMALIGSVLIVPALAYGLGPRSYVALPGTLIGIATAAICSWAFMQCPRRPVLPKLITFLMLVPGLYIGVYCVSTYLMFGLSR